MTLRHTSSRRAGYLYKTDGGPRVALYCEPCTSFYVKSFSDEEELQDFKNGEPFRRTSNCPYASENPSCCWQHEVIYAGDAPPTMVAWLESERPDWPKCPEDFVKGDGGAQSIS